MIVDSSALVALLLAEPGSERIERALLANPGSRLPAPCYLEVCMAMAGRFGPGARRQIDEILRDLAIGLLSFTEEQARTAADAFVRYGKGRHPAALNFGDCMAYAVAVSEGEPLLFVGGDFALTDIEAVEHGG